MSLTFEQQLEKYAELIVRTGVNIQPQQDLFVSATVEVAPLARLIAAQAYAAGARNVHIDWNDDVVSRLRFEHAADDVFTSYPDYEKEKRMTFVNNGAAFVAIVSSSPDLLKGISTQRIGNFQKATGEALAGYRAAAQANKIAWSVVAAASQEWANKVFPHATDDASALDQLWQAIFTSVRLHEADPVAAWAAHNTNLHARAKYLNDKHYTKLHYRAPGTDLFVELADRHIWLGASSTNVNGTSFMANMPTEEVFSVPKRDGVNGYVSSTKPLSYGGNIIDEFTITFEQGRIVNTKAKVGQDILAQLVATDEGSHYLGEVALVPHHSPISESNILFYNTLFDENASNHLAIGSGYAFNLVGGTEMTREQLAEHGVNNSITHVDFMIGSAEMDIDGILADGTVEPIFRAGNWAF